MKKKAAIKKEPAFEVLSSVKGPKRRCSVKKCDEVYFAKGLCTKHYKVKYRAENTEKIKAYRAKYYADNAEKIKAKVVKYYSENSEKIKAYKAKYYADNAEKIKAKDTPFRRRSKRGHALRCYCSAKARVEGRNCQSKRYPHIWLGKPICSKEDFMTWAMSDPHYAYLHRNWVESGYDKRLSPSVDRINSFGGYTLDNIAWLTRSDNSIKASLVRRDRHKSKAKLAIERLVKRAA